LKVSDTESLNNNQNLQNIITNTSSITEVLNILAFLTATGRTNYDDIVDTVNSAYIDTDSNGAIDIATGYYSTAGGTPNIVEALGTQPLIAFDTLIVAPPVDTRIPVSILKRNGGVNNNPDDPDKYLDMTNAKIASGSNGDDIKILFSNCVKQMAQILVQTRTIFGPKGWTELFEKVKGGSAKGNKHTHRRHRRKYSRKSY
jgi:hypothetical protein